MNDVVIISALIAAGASIVVGILSLIGVVISNSRSNNKMQSAMETAQEVTEVKLEELTREVRLHNDFAQRIPVIEEKIKVVNNRIKDLEGYHKPA